MGKLVAPSGRPVPVEWTTTTTGSATAGLDYVAGAGTVTIPAGRTSATIRVPVLEDALYEPGEAFFVRIGSNVASVSDPVACATIVDNEPVPRITASNVSVAESAGTATIALALSGASAYTTTVQWTTLATGTATAGADFTPASGVATFAPGARAATVSVPILDDAVHELSETFFVRLSSATHAAIGVATVSVTIVDDDPGH